MRTKTEADVIFLRDVLGVGVHDTLKHELQEILDNLCDWREAAEQIIEIVHKNVPRGLLNARGVDEWYHRRVREYVEIRHVFE